MIQASLQVTMRSLAIGALGGITFQFAGLPLPWMLGPLMANMIASARGLDVSVSERLRNAFLGVLGLVMGSQMTPQLTNRIIDWPLSAALLLVGIAASTALTAAWYRRCGFDPVSAWFASAPGAMTAMILLGDKMGGNPQRIAIAQSLRVMLVILILPPLFWGLGDGAGPSEVADEVQINDLWLLLILPLVIPLGSWIRLPTPSLLAPLFLAGSLGILDVASLQLPSWGMGIMFWVLGSAIGARFGGLSSKSMGKHLWQAGVATALALLTLGIFAELIHWVVDVPRNVAFLALAPGGFGEMAIVAVALGLDPTFVAFHHLLRMVALMAFAPLWGRWLTKNSKLVNQKNNS
ncbi:MAG: ammonia monooxygenase [Halomonas sp.]|jgi:membrane AbrB-like protein|nr:AbrB family transcriptional regulator [uncultured Halomonas sp.]PHR00345.1 MAG: ammonia monooxygenase [Halomonas sp.]|tara:strand:- start:188 stop:1237 length:1050 start_codon:yes stop_codon:yes gene_type:complete